MDGYIRIPRGLRDELLATCKEAGIEYELIDHREKGRPIRVSFKGDLKPQQKLAARRLLMFDNGILSAATAFGKTAVCSYLIAEGECQIHLWSIRNAQTRRSSGENYFYAFRTNKTQLYCKRAGNGAGNRPLCISEVYKSN